MHKRFISRSKKKTYFFKTIFLFLISYIAFTFVYHLINIIYISKMSNQDFINYLIKNTKSDKAHHTFFKSINSPQNILNSYFIFKDKDDEVPLKEELVSHNQDNLDNDYEVYIYNTHDTESYSSSSLEVYNIKPNVKMMNYILKDYLNDLGISVLIEEQSISSVLKNHNWSYKYSYEASKELISPVIKAQPQLKLIIDLHRDSSILNKTLLETDDKKYAKILFVVGKEHANYKKNLELATTLNTLLESEVPHISRGITIKEGAGVNGIYNQDLSHKSVLIELGGQYNEIEELNNSLQVLARTILKYLEENKNA